jgi:hypothetical protein
MHRYNNMDDSILAGLVAARNILRGARDSWSLGSEDADLEAPAAPAVAHHGTPLRA